MNTRRLIFWTSFIIVLGLIIWGLVVAMNKQPDLDSAEPTPVTATDNIRGAQNASITLIEYADFQCPACRAYYPIIERLFAESSTTLMMVYRHFPLGQHKNAALAAQSAEAAGKQGRFWEYSGLLYENQDEWSSLPGSSAREKFIDYANRLGLNVSAFTDDLDSDQIQEKVRTQTQEGISIGVNSTPTFFINGKKVQNPQSYEAFKALIDGTAATSTP